MDNVTHTLAGLVIAESAVQIRARRSGAPASPRFRTAVTLAGMVAANLPDGDLFYTGIGGDRLAYMLHHRGHTHTVVIALVGAALLWGGAMLLWGWRAGARPPRAASRWLAGVVFVAALSHLLLDWTNSYGVHPFWPFDDRWLYGDAVFIIEPWFWAIAVPALVAASASRVARTLLVAVLFAGLVLAWRVDLVATGAAAALTIGAALSVAAARVLSPRRRIAAAAAAWVAVTLVMATGARLARAEVAQSVARHAPGATLLDVSLSPLPANPLCTTVIAVELEGGTYRVLTARATGLPGVAAAARCGSRGGGGPEFRPSGRPSTRSVQWDSEWSAPVAELATLARQSCPALAALRFIRVPVWRAMDDSTFMLGDARFGGASGSGFSDVTVPRRSPACPDAVPSWTPPRASLLDR